jgi:hypothetical protein
MAAIRRTSQILFYVFALTTGYDLTNVVFEFGTVFDHALVLFSQNSRAGKGVRLPWRVADNE